MKNSNHKITISINVLCISSLLLYCGCASNKPDAKVSGLVEGILHGFISLFVLIGKLFGENSPLYAINNAGSIYWIGFVIGVIILLAVLYLSRNVLDNFDLF